MLSGGKEWDCGFPAEFMVLPSQRPLWGMSPRCPSGPALWGTVRPDEQQQLFQLDWEDPWVGIVGYFTCREGAASRRALGAVQSSKGYVQVCV